VHAPLEQRGDEEDRASFASSDGCTPMPPMPNQRARR
jgi:hypothetical protein